MKRILLIAFLILLTQAAISQIQWEDTNGPSGGTVYAIKQHPTNGRLYTLVSKGLYYSTDEGQTWELQNSNLFNVSGDFRQISTFNIRANGTMIAAGNNIAASSTDGGQTWTLLCGSCGFEYAEQIEFATTNFYVRNNNRHVYRSTNSGANWSSAFNTNQVFDLQVDNNNFVWLAAENGIHRSTSAAGNVYSTISEFGQAYSFAKYTNGKILVAVHHNVDGYRIYEHTPTTSTSFSFSEFIDVSSGLSDTAYGHLVISPDDEPYFLLTTQRKFFRYTGSTWQERNYFAENVTDVRGIEIDDNGIIYIAAYPLGIFKSSNAGNSWAPSNDGIYDLSYYDFLLSENGKLFITTWNGGIHRSSNAGSNWTLHKPKGQWFSILEFSTDEFRAFGNQQSVYSNDGGQTWSHEPRLEPAHIEKAITRDKQVVAATDRFEIWISDDKGEIWTKRWGPDPDPTKSVREEVFALDNANNVYFGIQSISGIVTQITKLNYGTWSTSTISNLPGSPVNIHSMRIFGDKFFVFVTESGFAPFIYFSNNAGVSWTKKPVANFSLYFDVLSNGFPVFYESSQSILISDDDATTWYNVGDGSQSQALTNAHVRLLSNGILYTTPFGNPVRKTLNTVIRPAKPQNLQARGRSRNQLALSWDHDGQNLFLFDVERRVAGSGAFERVYDTSETFVRDRYSGETTGANLLPGTNYEYRIKAFGSAGEVYSDVIQIATTEVCERSIPDNRSWTGTALGGGSNNNVGIKFQGNNEYLISDMSGGANSVAGPIQSRFFEDCGIVMPSTFNFNSNGIGTWNEGTNTLTIHWRYTDEFPNVNETVTFVLNASDPVPQAPAGVTAFSFSPTSIAVSWQSVFYEEYFEIERKVGAGAFTKVGEVNYPTTFFVDNGLQAGTNYTYRVRSGNGGGLSPYSPEFSVTLVSPQFTLVLNEITRVNNPIRSLTSTWLDADSDGLQDIYIAIVTGLGELQAGDPPELYLNKGNDLFEKAPLPPLDPTFGVHSKAVDIDNSGATDIYLFNFGPGRDNVLFRNTGGGNFTRITSGNIIEDTGFSISGSFVDLDKDGLLDFVLLDFQEGTLIPYRQVSAFQFEQFPDSNLPTVIQGAFSFSFVDFNNDGHLDMIVVSEGDGPPRVLRNLGNTSFELVTTPMSSLSGSSNGVALGDFNNDGFMDIFVQLTDWDLPDKIPHKLYRNNGSGNFVEVTGTPITATYTNAQVGDTQGAQWLDINNDGKLDLIVHHELKTQIFLNTSTGSTISFGASLAGEYLTEVPGGHFSSSVADYNNDGASDIYVSGLSASALLKNNNTQNNWLKIKLQGTQSNRSALGARIEITVGSVKQSRQIIDNLAVFGQSSLIANFGLGNATVVNSVKIFWPSGIEMTLTNVAANKMLTIIEDGSGPVISSTTPANNAENVLINTQLSIVFDEDPIKVAGKFLKVFNAANDVELFRIELTAATKENNTLTFPTPALPYETNLYVLIDDDFVIDQYGNAGGGISSKDSWKFKTVALPKLVSFTPANNATGIAVVNVPLSITFDKAVTAQTEKFLVLRESTGDAVVASIPVSAGDQTTAKTTFNYTITGPLKSLTSYYVNLDASAYTDATAGNTAGITGTETWKFTTLDADPKIASFTPADNAINIDQTGAQLSITLNKAVTAQEGKNINIFESGSTSNPISIPVIDGTANAAGLTFTYAIPGTLKSFQNYYVNVEAGAFADALGFVTAAYSGAESWRFRTKDTTPPTFEGFTAPATLQTGFNQTSLNLTVRDNQQVQTVVMFRRGITLSNYATTNLVKGDGDVWTVAVLENQFDAMGLEYYFEATDVASNKRRHPETGTFKTSLSFPQNNPPSLPTSLLSFGKDVSNYRMISVPYALPTNHTIRGIFDELEDLVIKKDWRLLTYAGNNNFSEFPTFNTFERGKGYWFIAVLPPANAINIEGASTPPNNQDNLFEMQLVQGWNQIGNPYTVPISWPQVQALNNSVSGLGTLKVFKGSFSDANQLAVMEGAYVFSPTAATIRIPFPNTSGGRIDEGTSPSSGRLDDESWVLPITFTHGEVTNNLVGIGMHPEASESYDRFDDPTLPRFINYAEVNFEHPEFFAKHFSKDVVPTQKDYMWEFSIETNQSGLAELKWDNGLLEGSKEIMLVDITRQVLIDMKMQNIYVFNPAQSNRFRIHFGSDLWENLSPDRVELGHAYPNPGRGEVYIPFRISKLAGDVQVQLELYNNMGLKIANLAEGKFGPGYYEVKFNTEQPHYSAGMYLIRLNISREGMKESHYGKLIIPK